MVDSYEFDPDLNEELDAARGKAASYSPMAPGRDGSTQLVSAEDDGVLVVATGPVSSVLLMSGAGQKLA